ncbi:MAG: hypothetical protein EOM12_12300 [Verrucomicrobiae bacterium]|nr:hypothetical protein [Bacteroidia bacterium]NCC61689.1 hypothetical protein [Verrucomicrobiae bacterium]
MEQKIKKTKNKLASKCLGTQREKEITKLLSDRYVLGKNIKVVKFLSLYIDCEAVSRKLIFYYRQETGKKSVKDFEKLQSQVISAAVRYFKLNINEKIIHSIFHSAGGIRGEKTPRQLRNALIHSKSIKDIEEIEKRNEELIRIMNVWITAILAASKITN